jgi:hypothetical protein
MRCRKWRATFHSAIGPILWRCDVFNLDCVTEAGVPTSLKSLDRMIAVSRSLFIPIDVSIKIWSRKQNVVNLLAIWS